MSQEKVGELFAELRIEDATPAQLRRAERNLDASVRRMQSVRDPEIGVDTSSIAPDLERSERAVDGFYRDVNGRLRNARGQFVKAGEDLGSGIGDGLGDSEFEVVDAISGWKTALVAAGALLGVEVAKALVTNFTDWAERDRQTDRLGAALGLSEQESARLGRIAGGIYADAWGENIGDVTRTIQFGRVEGLFDGGSTEAEIEAVTTRILDLAGVFEQDAAGIARAAGTMLRTGIAKDAYEALDILASGFQNGTNKADDLLDTFSEYSTIFQSLGIDGQTALGMLTQGLEAGARDSDFLADALKEFSIRGKDGSDLTADAFRLLGLDAQQTGADIAAGGDRARGALDRVLDRLKGIEDPVARNAAAVALFGTKAEDLQGALYAMDASTAIREVENLAGTAERISTQANDNLATSIEAMQRRVKMSVEDWLGGLWTAYESEGWEGVAEALGEDIESLGALWDEHGPQIMARLSEWWESDGKEMFGTITGMALEAAWDAAWERLVDYLSDPGKWVEMVMGPLATVAKNLADDLTGELSTALEDAWDILPDAFRESINEMIDIWNDLEFTLPEVNIPGIGKVGGTTISTPDLPHFAVGGTVPGPAGAAMLSVVHGGEVIYNGPQQQAMGRQLAAIERRVSALAGPASAGSGGRTVVYTARPERIARDLMWERAS